MATESRRQLEFLHVLPSDGLLLFGTRIVRLFAYGSLSVVLALCLAQIGLSETEIGALFSFTLLGDVGVSLWITTTADRIGRRRMLMLGAVLMLFAGVIFVATNNIVLLILAAVIGVISPNGGEIGPFLSIEQAALSQIVPNKERTHVFAWYALVGSFATACGALSGGTLADLLQAGGNTPLASYRLVVVGYALLGLVLILLFTRLSGSVEVRTRTERTGTRFGLHQSRGVVLRLSSLFALDAFGGGLIVQSFIAYWFYIRFGVPPAILGSIFFGANVLSGLSALFAARIAARIGLINTMVWTHIPSNLLLMAVPLMPNLPLAIGVLLVRFSISQMDVPTRQSYTMAVVEPDERSAAAGVTSIARSAGAAVAPSLTGALFSASLFNLPFFLSGGLKIIYDLILYFSFRSKKPPEEV